MEFGRSKILVGLLAAIRSYIPMVPALVTAFVLKHHMPSEAAAAVGTLVGFTVKFLYSWAFAKTVLVQGT